MTPKPSDSMSERARELANKYLPATDYTTNNSARNDLENDISAALTDAFNLGAGGAYEDAAQEIDSIRTGMQDNEAGISRRGLIEMSERIRQRTRPDAIAAIERKVSEARLEGANKLSDEIAVVFLAMGVAKLGTTQAIEKIKKLCREATTEWMQHRQAEAQGRRARNERPRL